MMDKLKITRVTRRRNEENSLAISYELNGKQHAYLVNPKTIIEHLIKRQDPTRIEVDGNEMSIAVYCAEKYGARQAQDKTAIILDYLWNSTDV